MEKKRIIFMGTPDFAVEMLNVLLQENMDVVAVVTQPDKPVGRKHEIKPTPVKAKALEHGIFVMQPEKIGNIAAEIEALKPDLIVTCAYGQFIPQRILETPVFGSINVHASLLPEYRGGAPIHKSILDGKGKTGISIMRMVKRMDAGDVMSQVEVDIGDDDTVGTLHDKLQRAGADLLKASLELLFGGNARWQPQDESKATFAYNITKEQEFVSFNRDVKTVYNHIRGLIPWPVGYGVVNGKKIKFHRVGYQPGRSQGKPGEILGLEEGALVVQALAGVLMLYEVQLEGKGKSNASDFFNGIGKTLVHACFEEKHES